MHNFSKTILGLAVATAITLPMAIADAASVAILPLINNSKVEDAASIFHLNAMTAMERAEDFHPVDTDALTMVIDKSFDGEILPTQVQLAEIAVNGGVDVVIAMQLDKLDSKMLRGKYIDRLQLEIRGKLVSYNALNGKFYQKNLYPDQPRNAEEYARKDFVTTEFARITRNIVGKALGNKKVHIDKPSIGW